MSKLQHLTYFINVRSFKLIKVSASNIARLFLFILEHTKYKGNDVWPRPPTFLHFPVCCKVKQIRKDKVFYKRVKWCACSSNRYCFKCSLIVLNILPNSIGYRNFTVPNIGISIRRKEKSTSIGLYVTMWIIYFRTISNRINIDMIQHDFISIKICQCSHFQTIRTTTFLGNHNCSIRGELFLEQDRNRLRRPLVNPAFDGFVFVA